MKLSLIVVCHHSSEVLSECVTSFRRQAAAAGVDSEVVAVDHSEDPAEANRVAAAEVDLLIERANRGYAAGLNTGIAAAEGEILLLANPDIRFFDGSLENLLGGLDSGFDIVGPQFVWDAEGIVLLPPAEDPAPYSELGRSLQRRWRWAWSSGIQRRFDELIRGWTENTVRPVGSLRGALLVVRKGVADRFGPLDEGYFLYFEETEWLWRALRDGARLGLVTAARVQHKWGHSTRTVNGIFAREEASRERFFERNYSAAWRWLLRSCARSGHSIATPVRRLAEIGSIGGIGADLWLASPFSHLMPALGCLQKTGFPQEFLDFCREEDWFVAAASRDGHRWRLIGFEDREL